MNDNGRLVAAQEIIERALSSSKADECIVIVSETFDADLRFANNTTTTNGVRRDRRVTVASFVNQADGVAVGHASGSGMGDVVELVRASEVDARGATAAEDASPLLSGSVAPDFEDPPGETALSQLSNVVGSLREAFARARAERYVLAGFAAHEVETTYLGTSTGIRRRHVQPNGTFELVAARDGRERLRVDRRSLRADFNDVSLADMEHQLVERLEWAKRPIEMPAGRYEALLPPEAVADLMVMLYEAASGRDAHDGRSVFSGTAGGTRVGEKLLDLPFDLLSDPSRPGIESAPFLVSESSGGDQSVFDNGAAITPTSWIAGGHLERLRYHRAGSRQYRTSFTPPIDNLVLELPGASASLQDLIAGTRRGLLLTCLWYIREVDPQTLLLTGLTRDGVYLVEDGEVVGAVNNFRFNESPLDVLARTTEAGRSERALSREWGEWMSRTAMPSLRVADFNMSSVSPAS